MRTGNPARRILGIDPGIADTGYGIISQDTGTLTSVCYGSITTPSTASMTDRLVSLEHDLDLIITQYQPQLVAIEKLFFNRNVTTALIVGQARGVVLLVCGRHHLPIIELTPSQVKQSISGYGKADKRQVQMMVKIILNLPELPHPDDAADALAIAIGGLQAPTL